MKGFHVHPSTEFQFNYMATVLMQLTHEYGRCMACERFPPLAVCCVPDRNVEWEHVGRRDQLVRSAEIRRARVPVLLEHPSRCVCEPRLVIVAYRMPSTLLVARRRAGPRLAAQLRAPWPS